MRRDCDWFAKRAALVWKATPGRSLLLLVPSGCSEPGTALLVLEWTKENFKPPRAYHDHRAMCIKVTSDAMGSSVQFTKTFASRIGKVIGKSVEVDPADFPTDVLENSVEAALAAGMFPVLVIERFHAFASIKDGGMTSVLAAMRSLEHGGRLATLALSPMTYAAIRQTMDAQQPFLNSVYGDNHDQAIMSVLSRECFIAAAQERNVEPQVAQRLYARAGGPDAVHEALLDLADVAPGQLVAMCSERAGPQIDQFLNRSVAIAAEGRRKILAALTLGRATPAEEAFLLDNPLRDFFCRRNKKGELICSSEIVARRILQGDAPRWGAYGVCLEALEVGDYRRSAAVAATFNDGHPRLVAFRQLVLIMSALHAEPDRGLLGVDWAAADTAFRALAGVDPGLLVPFRPWLDQVGRWIDLIKSSFRIERLQADELARRAHDRELRSALFFMIDGAIRAAADLAEPASRVNALVNIPETILQILAAAFCSIDFAKPPELPEDAAYDRYFGGQGLFEHPRATQKLTLSALLTIVPALLDKRFPGQAPELTDPTTIRPLHGKLVDGLRNPASHTVVAFIQRDADLLAEICRKWQGDWARLEDHDDAIDVAAAGTWPNLQALGTLLVGEPGEDCAAAD